MRHSIISSQGRHARSVSLACALAFCGTPIALAAQNADGIEVLDAGAVEAPLSQSAIQLAALKYPEKIILDSQILTNRIVQQEILRSDANAREASKMVPGLDAVIRKVLDQETIYALQKSRPALLDSVAIMLDRNFTENERQVQIDFYAQPLGQRLVKANLTSIDAKIIRQLLANRKVELTETEAAAIFGDWRERSMIQLSQFDQFEIRRWFSSALGIKMTSIFPEEDRLTLNWNNVLNQQLSQSAGEAMTIAVTNHLSK